MDKNIDGQNFGRVLLFNLTGHAGEKVSLSNDAKRWWWNALEPYQLSHIEQAFVIHSRRSTHKLRPADIIQIINQQDGRPSSDEAWPIALQASDEAATAVWTYEIEQAWFHCLPVFEQGDEVGARMTFRQYYDRLVSDARTNGMPVKWNVSLGHDPDLRKNALIQAEKKGLIGHKRVENLLPSPEPTGDGQHVAALVGYDKKPDESPSEDVKANIKRLRDELVKKPAQSRAESEANRKAQEEQRREELAEQERLLSEAQDRYPSKAGATS